MAYREQKLRLEAGPYHSLLPQGMETPLKSDTLPPASGLESPSAALFFLQSATVSVKKDLSTS